LREELERNNRVPDAKIPETKEIVKGLKGL
jgi:hypothetical protein